MPSKVSGFEYDIFISYRRQDNASSWVSQFVAELRKELASQYKETITIYFDENPKDGLNENHDVDRSLKEKLRCLLFIPILSHTYCDSKCFAWNGEFLPFHELAGKDQFGLRVKVSNGNVASRILPVRIHDLTPSDQSILETALGGKLRAIDFTFRSLGINRPMVKSDKKKDNANNTLYRDQVSKVVFAVREILDALTSGQIFSDVSKSDRLPGSGQPIPVQANALFGRDKELSQLIELQKTNRLITILGAGGMGKTRLVIELARNLHEEFDGNVLIVPLAAVAQAEEVIPTLANAMGIKEAEGRTLLKSVSAVVGDRKALIVLDNLEQVIAVAPQVAELISACPHLCILTTSRTPLKIQAEYEYILNPLPLPSTEGESLERLNSYPSISLFTDRAKKVNSGFTLTTENAREVVQICRRLDGLPLALELAAARIRMMQPRQLLQKLEHALDILTGGAKDLPERHQTLRATIDWSHSLLTAAEQMLFRRMSVFSGGSTMEAIEATCYEGNTHAAFDELESLVDKGLVQHAGTTGRFLMLETIKEYAIEKLTIAGEGYGARFRQAQHFQGVTKQISAGLESKDQVESMHLGIQEEMNIQSAMDFLIPESRAGNLAATELGLLMCGDLFFFWHIRGKHFIARHYSTAFLDSPGPSESWARSQALNTLGIANSTLGKNEQSVVEHQAAYDIAKKLNDHSTMCFAKLSMFIAYLGLGKVDDAFQCADECLVTGLASGIPFRLAFGHTANGIKHTVKGELAEAQASYQKAWEIQTAIHDLEGGGVTLSGLAQLAFLRGETEEAIRLYKASQQSFATIGDRAEEARILEAMAWTYLQLKDSEEARKHFLGSIFAYEEIGSVRGIGIALMGIAGVEAVSKHPSRAIEIATAAEQFSEQEGVVNAYGGEAFQGKGYLEEARKELTREELDRAVNVGKKLGLKEVLRMAGGTPV